VQRAKLVSAHAVQRCLYEALLYADGEDAVVYAEVANVVAALLEGVLDKLDAVQLRTAITDEREGGAAAEDPS
jgi:hypothetical protein